MKPQLKNYYSGYISLDHLFSEVLPYKGKNFEIDFMESARSCSSKITFEGHTYSAKEAIIRAKNIEDAEKVSRLILAALDLIVGHGQLKEIPEIIPFSKRESTLWKSRPIECKSCYPMGFCCSDVHLATRIACRASFRKAYYYALLKYRLGCWLHSNPLMDLDPCMPHAKLAPFPDDHIRLLYAIILFYSVIEELGMEIRASQNRPSFSQGKWNPKVKQEWELRVKKMGIDINSPISWNFRGTPSKIERMKQPLIVSKAAWSGGTIRDSDIALIDAINQISFIRTHIPHSRHLIPEFSALKYEKYF